MKAPFTGLRKRAEGRVQPFFALIVGLLLIPAAGAVTSQSFKVSATIVPGCAVATGSGGLLGTLDFGTHNGVESAPVSTSFVPNGALSIACTPGVALSMSINGGQNYSTVRRMKRSNGADVKCLSIRSAPCSISAKACGPMAIIRARPTADHRE